MDLIIRNIQQKDLDSFSKILTSYRKFKNFEEEYYDNYLLIKDVLSKHKYVELFVAELDNQIVGFIIFNQSFDITGRSIFIEDNFVLEEYREKKIGSSLFSKVLGYALENKTEKIKWSIAKDDLNYKALYLKLGANLLDSLETYDVVKNKLHTLSKKVINYSSELFKIREINNRDLPSIKDFIEEEQQKKGISIHVNIYDLMKYGLGDNKLLKILLLEVEDEIVGLMTYFDYFSLLYGKSAHIQFTLIKKDYKSIGIGRILNLFLMHRLARNKYNYVTIDIDKEDNKAKERMVFLDATLVDNVTVVEMSNNSLRELINI